VQFDATVPTISDRIAQTVTAMFLEPLVEPRFHRDSYGYRPGKSALEAVGTCRRRCWEFDWVIDLDVQKFFDTVPWDRALFRLLLAHLTPVLCINSYVRVRTGNRGDGIVVVA
jgi:RNA-directed DNA polymerase